MGKNILEVSDGNLEQVLASQEPVVLDFWAEWCGPCRMVGPIIEEIAAGNEGKVKVGKCNVDNNQKSAAKYNVMSIPTVIVFKGGKEVKRIVGARGKAEYQQAIDDVLSA